jgi:FKBP-type peptidyl-prolyl cis-trans isomerase SlyD
MQDQNGNPLDGKVLAVKEESVIMDFNHPLAGKDLMFTVAISDIRDATPDEVASGIPAENMQEDECCSSDGHGHGGGCGCH